MIQIFCGHNSTTIKPSLEFHCTITGYNKLCFDTGTSPCDISWYSMVEGRDLQPTHHHIHLEQSCHALGIHTWHMDHTEDPIRRLSTPTSTYAKPSAMTQCEIDTRFDFHTNTISF